MAALSTSLAAEKAWLQRQHTADTTRINELLEKVLLRIHERAHTRTSELEYILQRARWTYQYFAALARRSPSSRGLEGSSKFRNLSSPSQHERYKLIEADNTKGRLGTKTHTNVRETRNVVENLAQEASILGHQKRRQPCVMK